MKPSYFLCIIGIVCTMSSCYDQFYIPNHQAVNLFQKKNELILSGSNSMFSGLGAELGYSITNHIGVNTSFHTYSLSYNNDNDNNKLFSDYHWQNELILYNKFDNGLYIGLNAGYGMGKYSVYNPYYHADLQQKYLIPAIGYNFTSRLNFMFSFRQSQMYYQLHPTMVLNTDYDKTMFEQYFSIKDINNRTLYVTEPAFTASYYFDHLRLQAQFIRMMNEQSNMIPVNIVFSASVDMFKLFPKKKKK
jgi:hypothetical protein